MRHVGDEIVAGLARQVFAGSVAQHHERAEGHTANACLQRLRRGPQAFIGHVDRVEFDAGLAALVPAGAAVACQHGAQFGVVAPGVQRLRQHGAHRYAQQRLDLAAGESDIAGRIEHQQAIGQALEHSLHFVAAVFEQAAIGNAGFTFLFQCADAAAGLVQVRIQFAGEVAHILIDRRHGAALGGIQLA